MTQHDPIILAVAGAKGGVGKSMVCSNLAVQFAQAGLKTVLLDLDLGAANQHTLFGLSGSTRGWSQWLIEENKQLSDYFEPTNIEHLDVLAACGYHPGIAEILSKKQQQLSKEIKQLPADIVLLDLGAGTHRVICDFFSMADIKVLVTTTEYTSLLNNFEFLKNVLFQACERAFKHDQELMSLLGEYQHQANMKVFQLIEQAKRMNPPAAQLIEEICKTLNVSVVFNQVRSVEEAQKTLKLKRLVEKQLHLELFYPGFVFFSEEVVASMQKKLPISYLSQDSVVTSIFKRISQLILKRSCQKEDEPMTPLSLALIRRDFHKNRVERKKAHHLL